MNICHVFGLPIGSVVKNLPEMQEMCRTPGFDPWVGKIPWRRAWQPTPLFLLGKSHGQRSLAGYDPWGCKEPEMIERTEHTSRREGGRWGTSGESDS